MACIQRGGKVKVVKNLGWLLKHASQCEKVSITRVSRRDHTEARMSAKGTDEHGRQWAYYTLWASYTLACEWAKRRALAHTTITID
jgi:hypothetical protein